MKFSINNSEGQECPILSAVSLWGSAYGLFRCDEPISGTRGSIDASSWTTVVSQALTHLSSRGAGEAHFRVIEEEGSGSVIEALKLCSFEKKHDRIEYRAPMDSLPRDSGSPIRWEPIAPLGSWSEAQAAELLHASAIGDPDFNPTEDTAANLRADLSDPALTSGPDCVHIGFINSKPVAIGVAQIILETGWSRVTYMGVLPDFRCKGLGKWVHRHGFTMMRQQGGKLYHGGTVASNAAMISLFEGHGCTEYRRMQEWIYRF